MSLESWDDPLLNQRLLSAVDKAIQQCMKAYEGRAKSFAVILNDLEVLSAQLQKKLNCGQQAGIVGQAIGEKKKREKVENESENIERKLIYVRLFHREMPNLLLPKASKAWIKPLLESIQTAEKHGLAIYANEEEVIRSLKGECYGYATLNIKVEQDISDKRPAKTDPNLNCPLLILTGVDIDDLVKFTYQGVDYPFIDGVLQLPMADDDENNDAG